MGPPPDPEQMISLLENPQFASTMNEALQNPQVIDQMIQGNPFLRGMGPQVRQAMQDPNFRRMMTDPSMMRQMSQMSRQFGIGGGAFGGSGAGGAEAFPAPGVVDTTPGQEGDGTTTPSSTSQQPPINPFAIFGHAGTGDPSARAGGTAANPFAAFFNAGGFGNPSMTPGTSAQAPGQNDATSGATSEAANPNPSQQQPVNNPFANLANNPLFQNPALMQQMLSAMGGGSSTGTSGGSDAAVGGGQFNPFSAMFGPGGFGVQQQPAAPPDTRPPEERYEQQLRQLNDMGFYEFERNVEALRRTGGSVQGAVEYLLTH